SVPFPSAPAYALSKTSLGQLGMTVDRVFLNRGGSSRGASYLVLTVPGIRGFKSSDEALLLYGMDPEVERSPFLSAAGHGEIVERGPTKYFWTTLTACRQNPGPFQGPGQVDEYKISVQSERAADSAQEDTEIHFRPVSGLSALSLSMTPRLV